MNAHVINGQKIFTNFDYPPIPDRRFDRSAIDDEYDGAPDAGWNPVGHGRTEQEAIADYLEQVAEDARAKWFDKPLEDIRERWRELGNRETLTILETEEWGALEGYIEHMTGRKA